MKKNNTAKKAILDAQKISNALKEGTDKTLRALINQEISKAINEAKEDEESKDEELTDGDSYDVEDVEDPNDFSEVADDDSTEEVDKEKDSTEAEYQPAENDDEEWADMEDYKVGDNEYDFTGVNDDEVLKVYNKLGDNDQIFVKKEDDGTYSVKDDETGAEFVIELDPEALETANNSNDEDEDDIEIDVDDSADDEDYSDDDSTDDEDYSVDDSTDDEEDDSNDEDFLDDEDDHDIEIDVDDSADDDEDYSDEDSTDDDEDSTDDDENEIEINLDESGAAKGPMKKSHMVKGDKDNPKGFPSRGPQANITERVDKIVKTVKTIQAENKQYREYIGKIKQSLREAAVVNVNLGKILDILVNETTTKAEKKNILKRFNNVKTISEGTALYNTIKMELKESKTSTPIVEKQLSANSTKALNETTIYANNPSLNLMHRMDNLFKK